jgi:hypothetical protein
MRERRQRIEGEQRLAAISTAEALSYSACGIHVVVVRYESGTNWSDRSMTVGRHAATQGFRPFSVAGATTLPLEPSKRLGCGGLAMSTSARSTPSCQR